MGTDKAFVEIDGYPLVARARDALSGAGAARIAAVGGDVSRLAEFGVELIPDLYPGLGPLGGVVTALSACTAPLVVVLPCDIPGLTPSFVTSLVGLLDDSPKAAAAVPTVDGRRQVVTIAVRREVLSIFGDRFAEGERSLRVALGEVEVVEYEVARSTLADIDSPEDLVRLTTQTTAEKSDSGGH